MIGPARFTPLAEGREGERPTRVAEVEPSVGHATSGNVTRPLAGQGSGGMAGANTELDAAAVTKGLGHAAPSRGVRISATAREIASTICAAEAPFG